MCACAFVVCESEREREGERFMNVHAAVDIQPS